MLRATSLSCALFCLFSCSAEQHLGLDLERHGVPEAIAPEGPPTHTGADSGAAGPEVPISAGSGDLSRIAAGIEFTCAITASRGVKCWGNGGDGRLGTGRDGNFASATPLDVSGLSGDVATISARQRHTCVVTIAGAVRCWGRTEAGETGATGKTLAPVGVRGLESGVTSVAAGGLHTCARLSTGRVKCWGLAVDGRLGAGPGGPSYASSEPFEVVGITDATKIAAGNAHTCALVGGGKARCWGSNADGQLGDVTMNRSSVPVEVPGIVDAIDLAASGVATCAMNAGGAVRCWPALGVFTPETWTPANLVALAPGGARHVCGVTSDARVLCWGANTSGQLGDGMRSGHGPSGPSSLSVLATAGGDSHTCALTATGGAKCWGSNRYGELGTPQTLVSFPSPVDVAGW